MRLRYKYGSLLALVLFLCYSCEQKYDVWDSQVKAYSGQYVVKLESTDGAKYSVDYNSSKALLIYSDADDSSDHLWLKFTPSKNIQLQEKIQFAGTPEKFAGVSDSYAQLNENILEYAIPTNAESPTKENQTVEYPKDFAKISLLEGKIIKDAVKTKGGNVSDSIYLKIKVYPGIATFKSVKLPESQWTLPTVPEYTWIYQSMKESTNKPFIIEISGFRHTGFKEDAYN